MQTVLQRSALPLIARHTSRGRALLRSGSLLHCKGLYCKASRAEEAGKDLATGQVISKEANFVKVKVSQSSAQQQSSAGQVLFCTVRALLKKIKQTVLVGDQVQVAAIDWIDKQGVVYDVIHRRSETRDPSIANVDQMLLVMSLNLPPFDPQQATRFLVSSEAAEIPVTVLLNKADLVDDSCAAAWISEISTWGYRAIAISVASGQGLSELSAALKGKLSAVIGPSGVGKSSIINALRLQQQHEEQQHQQGQQQQQIQQQQQGSQLSDAELATADPALDSTDTPAAMSGHRARARPQSQANEVAEAVQSRHVQASIDSSHSTQENSSPMQQRGNGSARTSAASDATHADTDSQNGQSKHLHQQQQNDAVPAQLESPLQPSTDCQPAETSSAQHAGQSAAAEPQASGDQAGLEIQSAGLVGGLAGEAVQLQSVGEMSNIGRGMHTTRHVALLQIGGGLLADTPGFNVPSMTNLNVINLQACFPEVAQRLETDRCAFSNCQHVQEPGCCVQSNFSRHSIYVELYHEVKQQEELERHRSMSKKRRQGTVRFKTVAGGQQNREALLETKTHRRVNRRQTRQGMQNLLEEHGIDEET